MGTLFDEFKKMAEEEFGCTIVKSQKQEHDTFESLFGVDPVSFTQYQVPYSISEQSNSYFYVEPLSTNLELIADRKFAIEPRILLAA